MRRALELVVFVVTSGSALACASTDGADTSSGDQNSGGQTGGAGSGGPSGSSGAGTSAGGAASGGAGIAPRAGASGVPLGAGASGAGGDSSAGASAGGARSGAPSSAGVSGTAAAGGPNTSAGAGGAARGGTDSGMGGATQSGTGAGGVPPGGNTNLGGALSDCASRRGGALVSLSICNQSLRLWVTNAMFIAEAKRLQAAGGSRIACFPNVKDGRDCDPQWSWHAQPSDAFWTDFELETYFACPAAVEADKLDWVEQYGQYCGERSSVTAVDDRR